MLFTKRQAAILQTLQQTRPRERATILEGVDSDIIRALCDMCLNVLRGNVPLTTSQMQRLKRHKQTLRSMATRRIPLITKRKLIRQRGGFLPLLLPIIASAVGGLLSSSAN
jgi:hypothetical protein